MRGRWSNYRDHRDGKISDVLPFERPWEVSALPHQVLLFSSPLQDKARTPSQELRRTRRWMEGVQCPVHCGSEKGMYQLPAAPPVLTAAGHCSPKAKLCGWGTATTAVPRLCLARTASGCSRRNWKVVGSKRVPGQAIP